MTSCGDYLYIHLMGMKTLDMRVRYHALLILPSLGQSLDLFQVKSVGGSFHTDKEVNVDALIHILACPQRGLI